MGLWWYWYFIGVSYFTTSPSCLGVTAHGRTQDIVRENCISWCSMLECSTKLLTDWPTAWLTDWLTEKLTNDKSKSMYLYIYIYHQVSLPGLYPYFRTLDSSVWIHVLNHFPVEGTVTNTSMGAECSTCEAGGGGNTTWLGAMTM